MSDKKDKSKPACLGKGDASCPATAVAGKYFEGIASACCQMADGLGIESLHMGDSWFFVNQANGGVVELGRHGHVHPAELKRK